MLFAVGAGRRRAVDRRGQGLDAPFDPRIHALRGHRGQIETAAALRTLMAGSAIRESHATATSACRIRIACAASRR